MYILKKTDTQTKCNGTGLIFIFMTLFTICACSNSTDSNSSGPTKTLRWSSLELWGDDGSLPDYREFDEENNVVFHFYVKDYGFNDKRVLLVHSLYGKNGDLVRNLRKSTFPGGGPTSFSVDDFFYAEGRIQVATDSLYSDTLRSLLLSSQIMRYGYSPDGDTDTVQVELPWNGTILHYQAEITIRDKINHTETSLIKGGIVSPDGKSLTFDSTYEVIGRDSSGNQLYFTTRHPGHQPVDSMAFTYKKGGLLDSAFVFADGFLMRQGKFEYTRINMAEELKRRVGTWYAIKRGATNPYHSIPVMNDFIKKGFHQY